MCEAQVHLKIQQLGYKVQNFPNLKIATDNKW